MAVQAYPYLVMTDGTDTVTFANGAGTTTNWPLVRGQWSPTIAGLRTSPLAGRGPYADVAEDLSCNIRDTTAALCYQDLDTLARLLDKAERWWLRNEAISPVLLKYVPQGSTIHSSAGTTLSAIVLGRVGTDELNGVSLPQSLNDAGMIFEIRGIKVLAMRRGYWTGAEDSASSGAGVANPNIMTCTLATHPINSPLSISIGGFDKATTPTINGGYLVVGSQSTDIQIVEAEGAAGGVAYTSVADAANNARGGNVLHFTGGIAPVTSSAITGLSPIGGQVAILAAVRNNSTTTSFFVQAFMSGLGTVGVRTPQCVIDTSTTNPRIVLIGTLTGLQLTKLQFVCQGSAATGTLDIDYVILVNMRDETTAIIAHDDIALTNLGAGAVSLDFLFNPLTQQNPILQASGTGGSIPGVWRGPLPLVTKGTTVVAVWTATNGASWRFTTTAPAVMNTTAQAIRDKSYLSPQ